MLNIALPKGRLGDQVLSLFSKIGYDCGGIYENDRRLVLESPENGVRYLLVKPSDVAIYVEYGAADIGVVGKDILLDGNPDVYELLDLGIGKCRICVAGRRITWRTGKRCCGWRRNSPPVAKKYYSSLNREIQIIKLNGSIELAPILGLTDVIVDIVESGRTLKENHLKVLETIVPISARLIANRASYLFKNDIITSITQKLQEVLPQ
jgi:ATP phosphoribosyltransferase